jgi:hypothetical protein
LRQDASHHCINAVDGCGRGIGAGDARVTPD